MIGSFGTLFGVFDLFGIENDLISSNLFSSLKIFSFFFFFLRLDSSSLLLLSCEGDVTLLLA